MPAPLPRLLFAALAALALTPRCPAAEGAAPQQHTLRYKFAMGEVVRYEVVHNASVRSTINGASQEAITRSESTKAWKVIDVLPSGEVELQNVVERVKMSNRLPDRAEVTYDSASDQEPAPGFEDAARAIGTPLSHVRMTAWGKVLHRQVKHKQPAADPYAPVAVLLPEQPVAVGDTWDEPVEMQVNSDAGPKSVQTRRHYKLKSVERGLAVIEATQQVLSSVTAADEAQLAQRMMSGVIRFDIPTGRIVGQTMDVDRRVLAFAGPASSMHYVMHMEEKLADSPSVARRE